jgi:hypothetical protein
MVEELRGILTVSTDPASPAYAAPVDPQIWLAIKSRLSIVKQLPARVQLRRLPAGSEGLG